MPVSEPSPDLLPAGRVVGGCEIVKRLGQGGMGVVYEAIQLSLKRRVALKVLAPRLAGKPRFVARFDRETMSLANLSHPHIVAIFDRGVEGDLFYFTMEYISGESLRKRLRRGRLPVPEAGRVVGEILSALEHAHEGGVVHRDIKPENVLLDAKGRVKVADFGIAHLDRNETPVPVTGPPATGRLTVGTIGTPDYMAPEQRSGRPSDHRADLYAVGVVLFELLVGRIPRNEAEAMSGLPAGTSPAIGRLLWRLLAPDPKERFPSAGAAREALTAALSQPTAPPPAAARPAAPFPARAGRRVGWRPIAGVAGLLLSVAAVLFARGTRPPPGPESSALPPVAPVPRAPEGKRDPLPEVATGVAPAHRPPTPGPTGTEAAPRPVAPDPAAEARAAWAGTEPRLADAIAKSAWPAAHALLADYRSRFAGPLTAEPALTEAVARGARALEDAQRARFDERLSEATRLRDQEKWDEALQAMHEPAGWGSAVLDDATREFARRTRQMACDAGLVRARARREEGRLRDAVAAFRASLEYAEEAPVVLAVNGEIAALKRQARAAPLALVERLEPFVLNGRAEVPEDLLRMEKDPELADLGSFLRSLREDLEAFRAGRAVPRDIAAQWRVRLERVPVPLGDRQNIAAGERCERCEGLGADRCATCGASGSVTATCTDCTGSGKGTCPKCGGRRDAPCEACAGKGAIPKRVRVKCDTCLPRRCPDCGGTGFTVGYGLCGNCGGDGWLGSAGRVAGKLCPDCKGAKTILLTQDLPCTTCDSKGTRPCSYCHGSGIGKCPRCDGTGKVSAPCPDCAGAGERPCSRCKGSGRRPAR